MYGLDLFSGIGGITKALEGYVEPVAYCERERHAQAVLLSRMATGDLPLAPIWDDITTLRGSYLPGVDIIYGGFPCQDISSNGLHKGLEGERSGLFFEIIRLTSEIRPRFLFLENVSAITIRGAERVIGEFCKLRYDCRWGVLSARDVGAQHYRERWWCLAYSSSIRWDETEIQNEQPPKNKRVSAQHRRSGYKETWGIPDPHIRINPNGIPFWMEQLHGYGNAVVPSQAREAFERLMGLKPFQGGD